GAEPSQGRMDGGQELGQRLLLVEAGGHHGQRGAHRRSHAGAITGVPVVGYGFPPPSGSRSAPTIILLSPARGRGWERGLHPSIPPLLASPPSGGEEFEGRGFCVVRLLSYHRPPERQRQRPSQTVAGRPGPTPSP